MLLFVSIVIVCECLLILLFVLVCLCLGDFYYDVVEIELMLCDIV